MSAGHEANEIERRRFLKGAATVAWATPLILTMSAHTAGAQAMSCIPEGSACSACAGMPCCGAKCCCADALLSGCSGVCASGAAECDDLNVTPATEFQCFTPPP